MSIPSWAKDWTCEDSVTHLNGPIQLLETGSALLSEVWNKLPATAMSRMMQRWEINYGLEAQNHSDCVLIAICVATGLRYHRVFQATGRVEQWHGYKHKEVVKILDWLDIRYTFHTSAELLMNKVLKLGQFANKFTGTALATVPGHMVCVRNNTWNDDTSGDQPLLMVYILEQS